MGTCSSSIARKNNDQKRGQMKRLQPDGGAGAVRDIRESCRCAVVGVPDDTSCIERRSPAFAGRRTGAEVDPEAGLSHCKQHLAGTTRSQPAVHVIREPPNRYPGEILKRELPGDERGS